jgi:branched-chain amino acid transport system permease protein
MWPMHPRLQCMAVPTAMVLALAIPAFAPNAYVMGVITRICLYALLALGLNVVVGFAGLLDLGYVAFFGIGSYVYAFRCSPHFGLHWPFLFALATAVCVTAIFGVLIGAPTLRLRGDCLAIVTLGFGEITYILSINLDRPIDITGGPSGIVTIDPPSFFGYALRDNWQYYYLILLLMGVALLFSRRLRDSRIGWAWQAVREDELAAQAMGINTTVAKLQAFAIGASFAGAAGALLASWQRSVFPDNFLFAESVNILAMVILGGVGSLAGRDPRSHRHCRIARSVPRLCTLSTVCLWIPADGADDLAPRRPTEIRGTTRRCRSDRTDAGRGGVVPRQTIPIHHMVRLPTLTS